MYSMNQNYNSPDPSGLVAPQVLPHVHLISSYRFPTVSVLQPQQALEFLIKGPTIVKDTSPVAWTYFNSPPPDGTVLLTWQPPRLQASFASDGLVWADQEVVYDMPIKGYNVQVLIHKCGFFYPHEQVAAHARYRYRITNGPGHTDPNLWVVHYTASEPTNRVPVTSIPMTREVQMQLQARGSLESNGQLIRKEFMLQDRANWPKVEFSPRGAVGQQQAYYNPMQPGRAYNAPPPNKRARPSMPQQRPAPAAVADTTLEDEENWTQDYFDFLTPREISISRYKQHHEWMEEIFSSPHAVGRLVPIDLGLGLMGELAPLTAGILDAPGGEHPPVGPQPPAPVNAQHSEEETYAVKSYHKLLPEQLKDFETRVSEYMRKESTELEKMKAVHAKKMADLKRSRTYIKAERRLRDAPRDASVQDADSATENNDASDPLKSIVDDLESSLGVVFNGRKNVVCVEKGGYIEEQPTPPQKAQQMNGNGTASGAESSNGLLDALDENTAASLLDQYGTSSATGTPGANMSVPPISQPQSQSLSAVATPSAPAAEAPQTAASQEQGAAETSVEANDLLDLDVEMSGMAHTVGDNPVESTSNQESATTTSAVESVGMAPTADADAAASMFDNTDFGAFDGLDSAGDALADYTTVDDENLGLDLINDDSAFGDAFHGTEMHHGNGTEGQ